MSEVTHTKPVAVAAPPFSFTQVLPWLIFAAMLLWSLCTSSPRSKVRTALVSGTASPRMGARRAAPARLPLPLSPAP